MLNGIDELTHAGMLMILALFFELLLVTEAVMPNLSRGEGIIPVRRDNVNNAFEPFSGAAFSGSPFQSEDE